MALSASSGDDALQYGTFPAIDSFTTPVSSSSETGVVKEISSVGDEPAWGWDYVFVLAHSKIDALERILERLRCGGFSFRHVRISGESSVFVLFSLPEEKLQRQAESIGMKQRLEPQYGGGFLEYTSAHRNCFVNRRNTPYFVPSDRSLLIQSALRATGIDFNREIFIGNIKRAYALHDDTVRNRIIKLSREEQWWNPFAPGPLKEMKDYVGARTALYFGYLRFYTRMLSGLSAFSIVVYYFYHYAQQNTYAVALLRAMYGLALVFWSSYFIEHWQRRRAVLTVKWGLSDYYDEEYENDLRAEFQGEELRPGFYSQGGFVNLCDLDVPTTSTPSPPQPEIVEPITVNQAEDNGEDENDDITSKAEPGDCLRIGGSGDEDFELNAVLTGLTLTDLPRYPYFSKKGRAFRTYFTAIATAFFATCIAALTFVILIFKQELIAALGGGALVKIIPGAMTGILITSSDLVWKKVSKRLVRWENHRTERDYERSLVLKRFSFQFVSNFTSLFYIAFVKPFTHMDPCVVGMDGKTPDCLSELETQLAALIIIKSTVQQALEISVPFIRTRENITSKNYYESKLIKYNSTIEDYSELVIFYGYTAMFGLAFPLVALVCLINCLIERKSDVYKIFQLSQRMHASNSPDIGGWLSILKFLSIMSIITNSALIMFTGNTLERLDVFDNLTNSQKVVAFVVFEHLLLAVKWSVSFFVNETPGRVHRLIARQDYLIARWFNTGWKTHYQPYKPAGVSCEVNLRQEKTK